MNLMRAIKQWLHDRRHAARYIYGYIVNIDGSIRNTARLDKKDGRVYFVLWAKGEQGHKTDYWHVMGDGWENKFQAPKP